MPKPTATRSNGATDNGHGNENRPHTQLEPDGREGAGAEDETKSVSLCNHILCKSVSRSLHHTYTSQLVAVRRMNRNFRMLESRIDEVLQTVQDLGQHSPQPPQASCDVTGTTTQLRVAAERINPCRGTTENNGDGEPRPTPTSWPQPRPAFTESTAKTMRTIEIDGLDVIFDVASVPDPPTVSFADNVESLVTEWYSSQKLLVAGHGIPIRHWDKFYMKRYKIKLHAWDSLRSSWNNWKVSPYLLPTCKTPFQSNLIEGWEFSSLSRSLKLSHLQLSSGQDTQIESVVAGCTISRSSTR